MTRTAVDTYVPAQCTPHVAQPGPALRSAAAPPPALLPFASRTLFPIHCPPSSHQTEAPPFTAPAARVPAFVAAEQQPKKVLPCRMYRLFPNASSKPVFGLLFPPLPPGLLPHPAPLSLLPASPWNEPSTGCRPHCLLRPSACWRPHAHGLTRPPNLLPHWQTCPPPSERRTFLPFCCPGLDRERIRHDVAQTHTPQYLC